MFQITQFEACGLPSHLHARAIEKMSGEVFDAGGSFSLAVDEDEEWSVLTTAALSASDSNNVFLIDHAWTFTLEQGSFCDL